MYVVPGLLLDAFAHILNHKFTYALHLNTIVRAGGAGGGGGSAPVQVVGCTVGSTAEVAAERGVPPMPAVSLPPTSPPSPPRHRVHVNAFANPFAWTSMRPSTRPSTRTRPLAMMPACPAWHRLSARTHTCALVAHRLLALRRPRVWAAPW